MSGQSLRVVLAYKLLETVMSDKDTHTHTHIHSHAHDQHQEMSHLSDQEARVRALESILVEKGYLEPEVLDVLIDTYENQVGPRNGAKVVARAWCDPEFKARLLADATAAIASMGFSGRGGEHMIVLENTPQVHNVVVCTLCSCYPWPVLGLPPTWYKSAPYRSRVVIDPRSVLAEFGCHLPQDVDIKVWDSNSELRYLVLPMRPDGTEGWTQEQLGAIVTRDAMIGTHIVTLAS
jgi:nitrile hydratase subunit alpha